jgi:hypothetical protein
MISISRPLKFGMALAAAGLLIAGSLTPAAAQRRAQPRAEFVDPAAIAAFNRMSEHVAALKAFEFKTSFSFDIVAKNKQTVSVEGLGHYLAKRPDKLAADIENDLFGRKYLYDGKTLSILSKGEKYYAQIATAPTIREMLAAMAAQFAIEIPVADLFDLGTPHSPVYNLRSAFFVGKSEVDGIEADHWAFRSSARDWQLWIQTGDKPLPLKLTLIDRRQPTHPRYTVTLKWTDRTDIADGEFTFTPSAEQMRIEILRIGTAKGGN